MYCKYRTVENIASSVLQYELYRDQVYRYTPTNNLVEIRQYLYMLKLCCINNINFFPNQILVLNGKS